MKDRKGDMRLDVWARSGSGERVIVWLVRRGLHKRQVIGYGESRSQEFVVQTRWKMLVGLSPVDSDCCLVLGYKYGIQVPVSFLNGR